MREKTTPVRMDRDLLPPLRKIVSESRDELDLKKYGSISDIVTEAVKQFLRRQKKTVGGSA